MRISCVSPLHSTFSSRCLPWHACVENYMRLFLNKAQFFPLKTFFCLPLNVRIFRPFLLLRAFAQTSARKFTIQLWIPSGQGITDANPSGDDSELSYHLSTSPNTQGIVSHRHKTCLSSRRFLLALTEKQGKGVDCNGFFAPTILNSFLSKKRQWYRQFYWIIV